MSVKVEKQEKSMAVLTIEVDEATVEKALQTAYVKMRKDISVPGFRKGKVPRPMVEKLYGPGVFYQDAVNEMIPDAYDKAVEECGEDIVSRPEVDVVQIEKGKPFIFTATVALKPPVKLGKYKGVTIEKVDAEVTDEDVDAAIEKERQNNARTIPVEDRPVEKDDVVKLDFEGFIDGEPFEGGKGEDYPLTIGSGAFIPGFEDQLIGVNIGEEKDVTVAFPEDYQAKNLAGKEAVFKCTVHEIKKKELPELDDEFASEVSEFETLAEYREDVKKNLSESKEKQAKDEKESRVIEAIVKDSDIEIPDAMLLTQQEQMVDEFAQRMYYQGMSMDQYYQFTGTSRERMLEQLKPQAEERIRARLVLEEIAKKEGFEVSKEDLDDELKQLAEAYQVDLEKIKADMPERSLKDIKNDILVKKAAEFAVKEAKEK
ncbi:MAG: trigger factor [Lachnospiraceae bacterium]|nr:trigger factor [Lachnospiraceae bacterium]